MTDRTNAPAAPAAADDQQVPKGYWRKADGTLVPESKVRPIDKARHKLVTELAQMAKRQQAALIAFKAEADKALDEFIAASAAEYKVTLRGAAGKGNVSLVSFDGRYKVERQVADRLHFDERLQAAKALVDECVLRWGKGANHNLKAVVAAAFRTDKLGRVSVPAVLQLRKADIQDEQWLRAMEAVADSLQVLGTQQYLRFYERNDRGGYDPIALNTAVL